MPMILNGLHSTFADFWDALDRTVNFARGERKGATREQPLG